MQAQLVWCVPLTEYSSWERWVDPSALCECACTLVCVCMYISVCTLECVRVHQCACTLVCVHVH